MKPESGRTGQEPAAERPSRILLMDDEAMIRKVAGALLSRLGYEVVLARDGNEAVRLYREAMSAGLAFDAVILDLTVPGGMGGEECLAALKEFDPHVQALASSGYADDPIMTRHREHGFAAAIAKPYRVEELESSVRAAIGR